MIQPSRELGDGTSPALTRQGARGTTRLALLPPVWTGSSSRVWLTISAPSQRTPGGAKFTRCQRIAWRRALVRLTRYTF